MADHADCSEASHHSLGGCRAAPATGVILALLVLVPGSLARAADEPTFAPTAAWTGPPESTQGVALGDVDGDGDLDLVRGNLDEGATLYLNTGSSFAATPVWTGPQEPTASVALGDVDGDGDLDLVRGNWYDGATLYLNTGGAFAPTPAWTGPDEFISSVALGDVDGDGDLDLVRGGSPTALHLNIGGTFAVSATWTGPAETAHAVALGDVNGDGDLDLVVGGYNSGAALYLNTGGGFANTPIWKGPLETTVGLALGDVDGDGDLDLVRGNEGQGSTLYLNTGGTYPASPAWTGPADLTNDVALGDVDGDGDLDLVSGNDGQRATLYLGVGGGFAASPTWTGPVEFTSAVALGDVDGDGSLDLIRGNREQGTTLYLNRGGRFAASPAWTGPVEGTRSVVLGDIDGDGDLDLVRGNDTEGATLTFNTGGTFAAIPAWTGPLETTFSVTLGDVDGDGDLDLVRGNHNQGATLYLNTGAGFAADPAWTGPLEQTRSVALGDVDGDGDLDLVRGNDDERATLYLNTGGTFADDPAWIGPVEETLSVALGDVDGDGDLDLVRGNWHEGATLYLNTGGSFAANPAWSGPVEEHTYSVALGDVDGDGDLDLVRGNYSRGATLHLNTGATFADVPAWTGPVEETRNVALGDVDADGDLDLVRGNGSQGAALYLNAGGTLAPAPAWAGPVENTWSVALGDVDGDGDFDLVRGNDGEGATLYRNESPWISGQGPARHLPNNAAHLRWVRVTPVDAVRYRISFQAVDAEADPLWLIGEYQLDGARVWFPMDLEGSALRVGPFATSLEGLPHEVDWDVTRLPFDRRGIVIRLRAVSPPHRAGLIQFIPSYLVRVGRVTPARPALATSPAILGFPTLTVGDSATATLHISNPGNRDLIVDRIESPDPEVLVQAELPLVVPPAQTLPVSVVLAPSRPFASLAPLRVSGNDPANPVVEVPLAMDVRPLAVTTDLVAALPELPLGEAASVVVTPAAAVHVERGFVYYRGHATSTSFPDSAPLVSRGASFIALVPGQGVTEAGLEYYVRVENSGIFTTDPPGGPGSPFFYPVAAPGGISTAARADLGGRYGAGRDIPVEVLLPQGASFVEGKLFHRAGGGAAYDSLDLALAEVTPGVFVPGAVVPGSAVGPRGVEYWVRVQTRTRLLTDPAQGPAEHPRAVRTDVASLVEGESHAGARYRMVSVPLDLELPRDNTLEALLSDQPEFGPYDATRWRSFRYDPASETYLELSSANAAGGALRPLPGRAFWLIAKNSNRIDTAPVPGRSTPTDRPYRVTLAPGWNQVGDPFLFPVAWAAVSAEGPAGTVTLEPPVAWSEAEGAYRDEDVATLLPFEGYWVWNPTTVPVDLVIPPDAIGAGSMVEASASRATAAVHGKAKARSADAKAVPLESTAWQLQITAQCEGARDRRNFIGVAAAARPGPDAFDRAEPPVAPGPALSLYFLAADGVRRTGDFRPSIVDASDPATRGHRWSFDVAWSGADGPAPEVRLEVVGLDQVPPQLEVWLIDRTLERMIDVRQQGQYTFVDARQGFVSRPADARFELLVGSAAFAEAVRNEIPDRPRSTRLLPSFPNPIASRAVIRFETARAGRVQLKLYDVAGRPVRTLVDDEREPGLYELAWAGEGDQAASLAPGVYWLRLVAPDRTEMRKLVKIR